MNEIPCYAVADPGFPVGRVWTRWGGRGPPTQVLFTKNDAKTKELVRIGGRAPSTPP